MMTRPLAFLIVLGAWASSVDAASQKLPKIDGIDLHHRAVTTSSKEAQKRFDEGLLLCYAFQHEEAYRRFERAAEIDPECAMAYWGMALCLGPNINNPVMDENASKSASEAVEKAQARTAKVTPVERDLIAAISKRYAWPPPESRSPLDSAYANAMREVQKTYPQDDDIGTLFAESLMDLRPWDQWTAAGEQQPGPAEVLSNLETVLARSPKHAGANHLYIHAIEASPNPARALPSADRLRKLIPGTGHLVHMPSHIDIRLGRYEEAVAANQRAVKADLKFVEQAGRGGFFSVYRAHNYHFLTYAAMFDGQSKLAMESARSLLREVPVENVRENRDALDGFHATPYHVMVRFGRWKEILDEPMPPSDLKVTTAFSRYARTVALSALGRTEEAARELDAFEQAYGEVPESAYIGNNTARVVLDIARPMAQGELEYRRGNFDKAFELLRDAVSRDDALRYDEPWGWFQPVRHALGALLLEQGRVDEAEKVYRRDLEIHPGNGWSLHGLAEALRRGGQEDEAKKIEAQLAKSWSRADVKLKASCFCRAS
jgi:tetratricopeptide (TPR) repeat protein